MITSLKILAEKPIVNQRMDCTFDFCAEEASRAKKAQKVIVVCMSRSMSMSPMFTTHHKATAAGFLSLHPVKVCCTPNEMGLSHAANDNTNLASFVIVSAIRFSFKCTPISRWVIGSRNSKHQKRSREVSRSVASTDHHSLPPEGILGNLR